MNTRFNDRFSLPPFSKAAPLETIARTLCAWLPYALLLICATLLVALKSAHAQTIPYAISSGAAHTCAIVSDNATNSDSNYASNVRRKIKCWGLNNYGQLGDNSSSNRALPTFVSGISGNVTAIASGAAHTCAIISGGIKCWGLNSHGQLGDGSTTNRDTAVDVEGISGNATAIAVGALHSCAVVSGIVKCWGYNAEGELGNGTTIDSPTAVTAKNIYSGASAIALGSFHSCAIASGAVKCWGFNPYGELGDNSRRSSTQPKAVPAITSAATALSAGASYSCAIVSGSLKCWGRNYNGQLANDQTPMALSPTDVSNLSNDISFVSSGARHTCAINSEKLQCWGANNQGQVGDGTSEERHMPTEVSALSTTASQVSAGEAHSCAIVSNGIKCWGSNAYGSLGTGNYSDSLVAVDVLLDTQNQQTPTPTASATPTPQATPSVTPTASPASIRGHIIDKNGAPIAGVSVYAKGLGLRRSNNNGTFSFHTANSEKVYQIHFKRSGFSFSPASINAKAGAEVASIASGSELSHNNCSEQDNTETLNEILSQARLIKTLGDNAASSLRQLSQKLAKDTQWRDRSRLAFALKHKAQAHLNTIAVTFASLELSLYKLPEAQLVCLAKSTLKEQDYSQVISGARISLNALSKAAERSARDLGRARRSVKTQLDYSIKIKKTYSRALNQLSHIRKHSSLATAN